MASKKRIAGYRETDKRIFGYQSDKKRSTAMETIIHKPNDHSQALNTAHVPSLLDIPKSTNPRSASTKNTSQKSKTLGVLTEFQPTMFQISTYSLSDGLAKTILLLENAKDKSSALEAVYSLRQLESCGLNSPSILSLKTSQDFSRSMAVATSTKQSACSPTLGMTVNGRFLIQGGFCPKIESGSTLLDILEQDVDQKYFLSEKMVKHIFTVRGGAEPKAKPASSVTTREGGRKENNFIVMKQLNEAAKTQATRVYDPDGLAQTLSSGGGGLGAKTGLYAIPILTPNRAEKRQNGRRMKNNGDPSFTVTAQDTHGVVVPANTEKGFEIAKEGDSINLSQPSSKTRRGRVGGGAWHRLLTRPCNNSRSKTQGSVVLRQESASVFKVSQMIGPVGTRTVRKYLIVSGTK